MSSQGVSAGIDMALWLIGQIYSPTTREAHSATSNTTPRPRTPTSADCGRRRNDRRMWALHAGFLALEISPTLPIPVLAEAWRGGTRQASLARFLALCTTEALTDEQAKVVSALAARVLVTTTSSTLLSWRGPLAVTTPWRPPTPRSSVRSRTLYVPASRLRQFDGSASRLTMLTDDRQLHMGPRADRGGATGFAGR